MIKITQHTSITPPTTTHTHTHTHIHTHIHTYIRTHAHYPTEDGHDGGGTRSTINLSPGGRNSRHLSRQPHPSSSSSSSSSSTSAPHHPERGGRSTSRPRPRSEEIPLEDMITSGNLQHNSLSMPKVRV